MSRTKRTAVGEPAEGSFGAAPTEPVRFSAAAASSSRHHQRHAPPDLFPDQARERFRIEARDDPDPSAGGRTTAAAATRQYTLTIEARDSAALAATLVEYMREDPRVYACGESQHEDGPLHADVHFELITEASADAPDPGDAFVAAAERMVADIEALQAACERALAAGGAV